MQVHVQRRLLPGPHHHAVHALLPAYYGHTGTYGTVAGAKDASVCQQCAAGTYMPSGQPGTACLQCPAGNLCSKAGMDTPADCTPKSKCFPGCYIQACTILQVRQAELTVCVRRADDHDHRIPRASGASASRH